MRVLLEGAELELNAGLTVPQNAQRYYEKAKEMARKASGAKGALAITEELRASKAGPKKTRAMQAFTAAGSPSGMRGSAGFTPRMDFWCWVEGMQIPMRRYMPNTWRSATW